MICREFRSVPNPDDPSGALGDRKHEILLEICSQEVYGSVNTFRVLRHC